MIYYILEKKRTFTNPWVEDPYYIERKIFFSQEEAEAAASYDKDSFRVYSAPATLVAGTEDFLDVGSTHSIEV